MNVHVLRPAQLPPSLEASAIVDGKTTRARIVCCYKWRNTVIADPAQIYMANVRKNVWEANVCRIQVVGDCEGLVARCSIPGVQVRMDSVLTGNGLRQYAIAMAYNGHERVVTGIVELYTQNRELAFGCIPLCIAVCAKDVLPENSNHGSLAR